MSTSERQSDSEERYVAKTTRVWVHSHVFLGYMLNGLCGGMILVPLYTELSLRWTAIQLFYCLVAFGAMKWVSRKVAVVDQEDYEYFATQHRLLVFIVATLLGAVPSATTTY